MPFIANSVKAIFHTQEHFLAVATAVIFKKNSEIDLIYMYITQ